MPHDGGRSFETTEVPWRPGCRGAAGYRRCAGRRGSGHGDPRRGAATGVSRRLLSDILLHIRFPEQRKGGNECEFAPTCALAPKVKAENQLLRRMSQPCRIAEPRGGDACRWDRVAVDSVPRRLFPSGFLISTPATVFDNVLQFARSAAPRRTDGLSLGSRRHPGPVCKNYIQDVPVARGMP